ncbi:MAG TPA: dihydrodipicolinate synthase family protein [Bryobacteraceae bacterium]|jgi:4-hydroxy-tetrahydrodipicolinate synthase|nr:dihydrodipicolinate synthase family protein [Bryobacteraceae bacterium]
MPDPNVQGVLPAALTPRRADSVSIDSAAALELIEFLESHGVDGITLLGSTGEFLHFAIEDRIRFAEMAIRRARVPVIVNASHSTLDGAVEIGQAAAASGAAGVLLMPPYYFRYTQESIRAFVLEFASQVEAPIYLYNIGQFTTELKLETSLDLLSTGEFAGIKDSYGGWEDFVELQKTGCAVFTGSDKMYARVARAGGAGTISGAASVVPELLVALDRRARAGKDTASLEALAGEFLDRAFSFPFPLAFREAAMLRGLKMGPHASPVGKAECAALEEFRQWFRTWIESPAFREIAKA